jgi:hypothetical protein
VMSLRKARSVLVKDGFRLYIVLFVAVAFIYFFWPWA